MYNKQQSNSQKPENQKESKKLRRSRRVGKLKKLLYPTAFILQYVGLLLYFLAFHVFNGLFFNFIWVLPSIIFKFLYFALLFFFFKTFYLPVGTWFLKKYISENEVIQLLKQRQQFIIFVILYAMAYIGGRADTEIVNLGWFVPYMSICLVSHLIAFIVTEYKYRKAIKKSDFYEENDNKTKKK